MQARREWQSFTKTSTSRMCFSAGTERTYPTARKAVACSAALASLGLLATSHGHKHTNRTTCPRVRVRHQLGRGTIAPPSERPLPANKTSPSASPTGFRLCSFTAVRCLPLPHPLQA